MTTQAYNKYEEKAKEAQRAYDARQAQCDPYGPDTLYVHKCPDLVLDMHIRTHLRFLRGDGELKEDVSDEMVEKVRKIVRQSDARLRMGGIVSNLPKEEHIVGFLRKTWSEREQFRYIVNDVFKFSKEYELDLTRNEFCDAIQRTTIDLEKVEKLEKLSEWVEEWASEKNQEGHEKDFADALRVWVSGRNSDNWKERVENLHTKMSRLSRPYLD
jgi:hypothetical protein